MFTLCLCVCELCIFGTCICIQYMYLVINGVDVFICIIHYCVHGFHVYVVWMCVLCSYVHGVYVYMVLKYIWCF